MNKSYNMNIDSGEKTWLTPPHIIEALGPFDLDPCCPPNMPWQTAAQMVCRPDDGLAVDWTGKRVIPFNTSEGSGLGLSIAREIVRHHHGTIHAENTVNGLKIIISLPILNLAKS